MNKGLGFLLVGILAIIGGAAFAALFIKNKLSKKNDEIDFDDFDTATDDEEFEHFFDDDDDAEAVDEKKNDDMDETFDELKAEKEEQL